jgi:large subunit ribosomal protein L13
MVVVDATDQILGRMASIVAKRLLEGESIIVVNTEKAVISGDPKRVIEKYKRRFDLSRAVNPRKGPFYPRSPDRIVSRAVRGMLPWSKPRGKEAFRHLRVHRGVPESLSGEEMLSFEEASVDRIVRGRTTSVGEISLALGMKKEAVM